jgi:hypothetical protein
MACRTPPQAWERRKRIRLESAPYRAHPRANNTLRLILWLYVDTPIFTMHRLSLSRSFDDATTLPDSAAQLPLPLPFQSFLFSSCFECPGAAPGSFILVGCGADAGFHFRGVLRPPSLDLQGFSTAVHPGIRLLFPRVNDLDEAGIPTLSPFLIAAMRSDLWIAPSICKGDRYNKRSHA